MSTIPTPNFAIIIFYFSLFLLFDFSLVFSLFISLLLFRAHLLLKYYYILKKYTFICCFLLLLFLLISSIDACAVSSSPDSGVQCLVMADSDPSSSINDTVTVNVGTLSNAIAAAIQQSRTASRRLGSGLLNSAAIASDRVPTFTVRVSLIEDDDGSDSAITGVGHCTPLYLL